MGTDMGICKQSVEWQEKPNLEFCLQITPTLDTNWMKLTHNCALRDPPFLFLCIIYDSFISEWYGPIDYCSCCFRQRQHSLFLWLSVLICVHVYLACCICEGIETAFLSFFFLHMVKPSFHVPGATCFIFEFLFFFNCFVVISTVLQSVITSEIARPWGCFPHNGSLSVRQSYKA